MCRPTIASEYACACYLGDVEGRPEQLQVHHSREEVCMGLTYLRQLPGRHAHLGDVEGRPEQLQHQVGEQQVHHSREEAAGAGHVTA